MGFAAEVIRFASRVATRNHEIIERLRSIDQRLAALELAQVANRPDFGALPVVPGSPLLQDSEIFWCKITEDNGDGTYDATRYLPTANGFTADTQDTDSVIVRVPNAGTTLSVDEYVPVRWEGYDASAEVDVYLLVAAPGGGALEAWKAISDESGGTIWAKRMNSDGSVTGAAVEYPVPT